MRNPFKVIILIILVALAMLAFSGTVVAKTEHCPEGGVKTEANGDTQDAINDTVLPAGTAFCVKGSTDATGILIADGETTLKDYLDNGHDVSYFVVYEVIIQPSPMPSTEPSVEASVEPSVEPTPAPTSSLIPPVVVINTPTPEPVPNTAIAPEELSDGLAAGTILTLLGGTLLGLATLYLLSNKPYNGKRDE